MSHASQRTALALGAVLAVLAGAAATVAPVAAAPSARARPGVSGSPCSGVQITHFYFSPRTVIEGQQATLRSTVQNCTSQTFTGSLQTFGKLACVVVDPTATKVVLKPGSSLVGASEFVAPNCPGSGRITGRLLDSKGKVVFHRTAGVTIVVPPPG